MTQEEKEYFQELIVKAVQSGKQETSGLVSDIQHKITTAVAEQVKETVNGKIDKINHKIDEYIIADNKWKESVTPSIDAMKKIQDFSSVSSWIFKGIMLLGGACGVLYGFYNFLKD